MVRAKARLAARGFSKGEGIDFIYTFPLIDLDFCHSDAVQAFVQSSLEADDFMRLPPGCGEISGKIVRLNRILYGLTQASRSWHNYLVTLMKSLGFKQSLVDACVLR